MQISKNSDITTVKGVGEKLKKVLANLSIETVEDLIKHIPFRYRDTREILSISEFKEAEEGTFLAQIVDTKNIYTRSRKKLTVVKVVDNEDKLTLTFFNQTYLTKILKKGDWYIFDGKITNKNGKNIYNPKYEKYQGDSELQTNLGKIYGIYHETKGVTSRNIRKLLLEIKSQIPKLFTEYLPPDILQKEKLVEINEALVQIHFPDSKDALEMARERLAFDEMLRVALKIEEQAIERSKQKSKEIKVDEKLHKDFLETLPYQLTKDQNKAIDEIYNDIAKDFPMNRLLNGDVGSGKTVVAASAILQCVKSGYSAILLAPTTVLAKQHFETLKEILKPLDVDIELCISEEKTISDADNKLIVGTHAVLFQKELPEDFNLLIVDEQHRFGVEQRELLLNIGEYTPHYLTMTATPIPRSLTEVVFGSTDISVIKQKPARRIEIETKYVPLKKRDACFEWIRDRIINSNNQEQAFFVYPIIEEKDNGIKSVKGQYKILKDKYFRNLNVALLHGGMRDKEKQEILNDFRSKKYNILVSTSVIEVGIDIPDATIMVIENAERFGLAQLHQLRGRVGRSDLESYCFVIPSENIEEKENSLERLKYFSKHNSGFDVAEYDLQQRGPGEVYGVNQSGIPQFKVASLGDIELLHRTRKVARELLLNDNYNVNKIKEKLFI
ncbi:MAG: ATP-dependent DNA helicase RecG [candidate division WS6 bacterium 34_10]|uniref:Probable DNA 3'-5' helicase RecG n=1 Tax=candidate division WS6 bacterium 34_10 TaxID=1641389 RepID=A0A101HII8_9BACT|nr:MAG: ATP-dependent DNA helicase RecG [candidate division WS6 bacterium 34_10]